MRLQRIKLAGFKSFVDPTTIEFKSNLVAILGPNGCGKSNVIDAVRWVMGESSAKQLRGDSSTDVIFSGSQNRKPVGQASVELVFDNSDGTIGGEYAGFSEISIRRLVDREGISQYFLNGTKCRRKDITDIFLGTGLGPRSYSVIEQGMISRFIEAKPDEMRIFLEEAAGISKYKERRRETENRIKHTRENLDRLNDLRQELEKQLNHLERQAQAAVKFKAYQSEERLVSAQLLAMSIQSLETEIEQHHQSIQRLTNDIEAAQAQLSSTDTEIEKTKLLHIEKNDALNDIQKNYYQIGAEIAKEESAIEHLQANQQQLLRSETQLRQTITDTRQQCEQDQSAQATLVRVLDELVPKLEIAKALAEETSLALEAAEEAQKDWQANWDALMERAQMPAKQAEVQKTHLAHLESQHQNACRKIEKLQQEKSIGQISGEQEKLAQLNLRIETQTEAVQTAEGYLETYDARLEQAQSQHQATTKAWDEAKQALQIAKGQYASLEALQRQMAAQQDSGVTRWLSTQGLESAPTLLQTVKVASGWEYALEVVLGEHLKGRCLSAWQDFRSALASMVPGLNLISPATVANIPLSTSGLPRLSDKLIEGQGYVAPFLAHIYCADDWASAERALAELSPEASIITKQGIWMSHHWLCIPKQLDETQSVIRREQEMVQLRARIQDLEKQVSDLKEAHERTRLDIDELMAARKSAQQDYHQAFKILQEQRAELKTLQTRIEAEVSRQQRIVTDIEAIQADMRNWEQQTLSARQLLSTYLEQMEQVAGQKEALLIQKESVSEALIDAKLRAKSHREELQTYQVEYERQSAQLKNYDSGLVRMRNEMARYEAQLQEVTTQLAAQLAPIEQHQATLHIFINQRADLEKILMEARALLSEVNDAMQQLDLQKNTIQAQINLLRQQLEQVKLDWQGGTVRRQAFIEQLQQTDYPDSKALLEQLPPDTSRTALEEQQAQLLRRIERLGPINLAAIEEFDSERERKGYLDQQHADLVEALEVLEQAIRKIDRETKDKFKETFDIVANHFHTLFPKLFGGGHAKLELTGEDLLETGVSVMACPPGKRNQLLSQLSGGEKALTAVALVFSIFKLNPAPFCLLDEVDAPLDDANVGRFCNMVKMMSDAVQFIFISHNKLTMELADYLIGVTMKEPGVSRFVSVDMAEAVKLVEEAPAV